MSAQTSVFGEMSAGWTLPADEVHVWSASLERPPSRVERMRMSLAEDERARAERFRFERDRSRYIVGRALLRGLLARYRQTAPQDLVFEYGEFDKPGLFGGPWFNLSHSGSIALYAFSSAAEIGVDVEVDDPEFANERIAERFFSPAEVSALRALPVEAQARAFLTCWTRKEAFIKARGDGLSLPLDSFDVTLSPHTPAELLRTAWSEEEPRQWCMEDLSDRRAGYIAAVALRCSGWRVLQRQVVDNSEGPHARRGIEMSAQQGPSVAAGGLRGMRRKAVQTTELVQTGFLPGNEGRLPLVITPAVDNVDLAAWCASHAEEVESYLDRHGAIMFRGFPLTGAPEFEAVASTIAGELFGDYGDLPPEETGEKIYHSTPYPHDKMILFHNESSHFSSWPMRQFFFCVLPSETQGESPMLDCREVYEKLDKEIVEEFERKDLMYVRNFSEGVDVPWQDFFHTDDKAAVEQTCAKAGMTCEWTELGLRVRQLAKGVRTHPRTGEPIFFNQVQLHHVACLDEETRTALRQLFADEDLPRNVYYGDGSPISDEVMDRIGEVYEQLCVETPWQKGDLIALDNMLVAHARRPFTGERKIIVGMGKMEHADDTAPTAA